MFPIMRVAYEPGAIHTGIEAMIGVIGAAATDLDPEGFVSLGAERWRAVCSDGRIPAGSAVRVREVRDLTLIVEPAADPTQRY